MLRGQQTQGEKLSDFIEELLDRRNNFNVVEAVDALFNEEGRLEKLIRASVVNYALRRLTHSSQSLIEESDLPQSNEGRLDVIRQYISDCTDIDQDSPERSQLEKLIFNVINTSKRKLTKDQRKNVLEDFQKNNISSCYICGTTVDFETKDNDDSASVEHIFPREFGGDTESHNFALSCRHCNGLKDCHIDSSDYHYESITTKYAESNAKFYNRILKKSNIIAICANNLHECSTCRKRAEEAGRVNIRKRNKTDGWHFLNIETICNNAECTKTI
jgi:hypothetical protein